jgi:regulator of protease activity HflC (stomatin/prohibitin superfamily)
MIDLSSGAMVVFALFLFIILIKGVKVVPQQEAWILERLGKFDRKMEAGLHLIIPFIDIVAYRHSLKEEAIDIREQSAITKDNVTLLIDGVLYLRIIDPTDASYGISNLYYAVTQLAQTTMRSEIGKMTMDKTFEERETLNIGIVNAINVAATAWGVQCMRYEIRDINPPESVIQAMELQMAAERKKRADILESEGKRQAKINIAEAEKAQVVLESEAAKMDKINRAAGDAEAITLVAEATAKSIEKIGSSIGKDGGSEAVSFRVAEQYVTAFSNIAKQGNTIIVPSSSSDVSSMVTQAMSIFETIKNNKKK